MDEGRMRELRSREGPLGRRVLAGKGGGPCASPQDTQLNWEHGCRTNRETALPNSVCDAHEVDTVSGRSGIKEGPTEVEGVLCPGGPDLPSGQAFFPRRPPPGPAHSSEGPGCAQ